MTTYRFFDVYLNPQCCALGVRLEERMNGIENVLSYVSSTVAGDFVEVSEADPLYRHGNHPFDKVYDIRGYLSLYKEPRVFGWVKDGVARYLVAVPNL